MIDWRQGDPLEPHRFQLIDRGIEDGRRTDRMASMPYSFGVFDMKLSREDLANGRVKFDELSVIMPDGAYLRYPQDTRLESIDVSAELGRNPNGLVVSIGLPDFVEHRPNIIEDGVAFDPRNKSRYVVDREREIEDERTGTEPAMIPFRRYNARLTLQGEDMSGMQTLELLRLKAVGANNTPQIDETFAPRLLNLRGASDLFRKVERLLEQMARARELHANRLLQGGEFSFPRLNGEQTGVLLRLRSIGAYLLKLNALMSASCVCPLRVFSELSGLYGELSALAPQGAEFKSPAFAPTRLGEIYSEIVEKIAPHLEESAAAEQNPPVEFESTELGYLRGKLDDEHLVAGKQYYLSVDSEDDPALVIEQVHNQNEFILTPERLLRKSNYGIPLRHESRYPSELVSLSGRVYFRLEPSKNQMYWELIQEDRVVYIKWGRLKEVSWTFKLYII